MQQHTNDYVDHIFSLGTEFDTTQFTTNGVLAAIIAAEDNVIPDEDVIAGIMNNNFRRVVGMAALVPILP